MLKQYTPLSPEQGVQQDRLALSAAENQGRLGVAQEQTRGGLQQEQERSRKHLEATKVTTEAEAKKEQMRQDMVKYSELAKQDEYRLQNNLPLMAPAERNAYLKMHATSRALENSERGGNLPIGVNGPVPRVGVKIEKTQKELEDEAAAAAEEYQKSQVLPEQVRRIVAKSLNVPTVPQKGAAPAVGTFDINRLADEAAAVHGTKGFGSEQWKQTIDQLLAAQGGPNRAHLEDVLTRRLLLHSEESGRGRNKGEGFWGMPGWQTDFGPYTINKLANMAGTRTSIRRGGKELTGQRFFSPLGMADATVGKLSGTSEFLPTVSGGTKEQHALKASAVSALLEALGYGE